MGPSAIRLAVVGLRATFPLMSRPCLRMPATRLLVLSCVALLGACGSDASGADTDGETDTDAPGGSANETIDSSAGPSNTSNDAPDPSVGSTSEDTAADGSSSGDPTDPTGDPDTSNEGSPQIPELQGECPEFTFGVSGNPARLAFPVGTGSREALVWFDPAQGGGGPLVFFFHGSGGEPEQAEDTVTDDAIADVISRGGMVIAPFSDNAANFEWFLASGSAQNDVVMMDSMVACAAAGPGIDPYHIHSVGFSAGGLHVAISAILRASYIASTITYSGGVYGGVTPDTTDASPSALAFHGGASDNVSGLPFDQATALYTDQLRNNGGYALVCNHNTGHGYPENVQGEFRRADTYGFLLDHPWGVDPHPYEGGGVPEWVPPYCSDQP